MDKRENNTDNFTVEKYRIKTSLPLCLGVVSGATSLALLLILFKETLQSGLSIFGANKIVNVFLALFISYIAGWFFGVKLENSLNRSNGSGLMSGIKHGLICLIFICSVSGAFYFKKTGAEIGLIIGLIFGPFFGGFLGVLYTAIIYEKKNIS